MRAIPTKLRAELDADPYYKRCCITGIPATQAKIEWHHAFIFAGRQVNERWCILPLEKEMHRRANEKWVRELTDWIMLNRADEATLRRYSKAVDLIRKRDQLNKDHGIYKENSPVL